MKTKKHIHKIMALTAAASIVASCGNETSTDDATDTSSASSSSGSSVPEGQVGVTGTLALSYGLTAASAPNKVLAFPFLGTQGFGDPKSVDVDVDGKFNLALSKEDDLVAQLESAIEGGVVNREKAAVVVKSTVEELANITDQEIIDYIKEQKEQQEARGGPMFIMVAMNDEGSKVEQAESFRFIGMPVGSTNMVGLPIAAARGNLAMGTIAGEGDEGKAATAADASTFDLPEGAFDTLASAGKILKEVKNQYVNGDNFTAQNFYLWKVKDNKGAAVVTNKWSTPADVALNGLGFYIGVRNAGVTFDELCPASGSVASKAITLVPPGTVKLKNHDNTTKDITAASPFNNGGLSRSLQDGKVICGGSETGFYIRDDGDGEMMINWGTGGSIDVTAGIPSGWWHLKLAGTSVAQFDMSAASPVDASGNARVFLPVAKATVDADGYVKRIDVKVYVHNGTEYKQVTDPTTFNRIASDFAFGAEIFKSGGGSESIGGTLKQVEGEAAWYYDMPSDKPFKFSEIGVTQWGTAGYTQNFAVYYQIGSQSFRMDWGQ
jgi:hypothetical protein